MINENVIVTDRVEHSQTPKIGNITWVNQKCTQVTCKNFGKWQKLMHPKTVTQGSPPTLGHPYLGYGFRISDRPFSETGSFEALYYTVLANFGIHMSVSCLSSSESMLTALESLAFSCPNVYCMPQRKQLHMVIL